MRGERPEHTIARISKRLIKLGSFVRRVYTVAYEVRQLEDGTHVVTKYGAALSGKKESHPCDRIGRYIAAGRMRKCAVTLADGSPLAIVDDSRRPVELMRAIMNGHTPLKGARRALM